MLAAFAWKPKFVRVAALLAVEGLAVIAALVVTPGCCGGSLRISHRKFQCMGKAFTSGRWHRVFLPSRSRCCLE